MVTVALGQIFHSLKPNLQPFELGDAQVLVALLPDLPLFELHGDRIRAACKLASGITYACEPGDIVSRMQVPPSKLRLELNVAGR